MVSSPETARTTANKQSHVTFHLHLVFRDLTTETYPKASDSRLLRRTRPHTGIIEFLVGCIGARGVADLALQIIMILGLESPDAVPGSPLQRFVSSELWVEIGGDSCCQNQAASCRDSCRQNQVAHCRDSCRQNRFDWSVRVALVRQHVAQVALVS